MKKLLLESLGFNHNDALVYEALVSLGKASPSELVRKTGLHRPEVYKSLLVLIEKGLIAVSPKGKYKEYVSLSPEKLESFFRSIESDFLNQIEDMYRVYKERENKPTLKYEEGKEAIRDAFSQMVNTLKKGEKYYRYSSTSSKDGSKSYVPKDYRKIRDAKGLERLVITNEFNKKRHSESLGRTIKMLPDDSDQFEYGISELIYRDRVVFLDYNSKSVITIDNKKFAEFQKRIFKTLFKRL